MVFKLTQPTLHLVINWFFQESWHRLTYADTDPIQRRFTPDADSGGSGMTFSEFSPLTADSAEDEEEIDFEEEVRSFGRLRRDLLTF